MITPITLSDEAPSMKSRPMFMFVTVCARPNGTTMNRVNAVMQTQTGANQ
jgi:hypothetical protein